MGDYKSNFCNINTGVPLLFLIYINDFHISSNLFQFIMYADDTTLLAKQSNFNSDNNVSINSELEKISKWLHLNKLSINASKSKGMLFQHRQKKVNLPVIKIDNCTVNYVNEFNFLGLVLDKHLSWSNHVTYISSKITRNLGIINRLKQYLPTYILKILYNSLVLPHLHYCVVIWGKQNDKILKLQKRAVRIISIAKPFSHSDPLFKKLRILKINDIYELNLLKLYFKIAKNMLPIFFSNFTNKHLSSSHSHNTRHSHKLKNVRPSSEGFKKCTRYQMINLVNSSDKLILDKVYTHSITGFVNYIKNVTLNSYYEICTINNCYVCGLT